MLTVRQSRIVAFIREHTHDAGYPPSVREIGDAVGLTSTSSVHRQLRVLAAKGHLRRSAGRCRAVVALDTAA